MQIDYTQIFGEIASLVAVVAPLAVTLGLCQWVTRFILNAIMGNYSHYKL